MTKKSIALLLLVFVTHIVKSQVLISLLLGDKLNSDKIEFGLDLGYNYSKMTGFESGTPTTAFNLGFYFDFKLKNQLYLNTGVLVKSNVGLNNLRESDVLILDPATVFSDSGSYEQKTSYFHVPVALKYRFKNHFYVHLGPQFALRTKAFLTYSNEKDDKELTVKTNNSDLFNRIEVAAIGGIGYKLRKGTGMNVGIKYVYGLTNAFKDDNFNSKNNSFYVHVGIPIGRAKPEETK
ncbi:MAG: PorT family protein [Cyclobacteriaceae bacterium]|nr:PorT family protein [Cyclobacteriaceae bacterium]